MEEGPHIVPPFGEEDTEGAKRVFEEFLVIYKPALARVEHYLKQTIDQMEPSYAEAYRPWHKALHDLFRGVYLMSKNIPLPDPESFMESLRMFSFDSAIQFLRDLCISCRIVLEKDWMEHFREHINLLLFSVAIMNRQQQTSLAH